jgi:hypothetical protein
MKPNEARERRKPDAGQHEYKRAGLRGNEKLYTRIRSGDRHA